MIGLENRESLFTHLRDKTAVGEEYLVRHCLGIQRALGDNELDNVFFGYQKWGTLRTASLKVEVIWRHYCAYYNRAHAVLTRFARCGERHSESGSGQYLFMRHCNLLVV